MNYDTFEKLITSNPHQLEDDEKEYLRWVSDRIEEMFNDIELGQDEEYNGLNDWERNK